MAKKLEGKRVAIVVAKGFEQVEMTSPREALEEAGAETDLISTESERVKAWRHTEWGESFEVDVPIDDASWKTLEPAQRRQRTLDAVRRLLLTDSRIIQ